MLTTNIKVKKKSNLTRKHFKDVSWNKLLRGEIDQIWHKCTMGYEKYKTKLKSMGWHSRFYFISFFRIYLYVTFSKKY